MSKSRPQSGIRNQLVANRELIAARTDKRESIEGVMVAIGRRILSKKDMKEPIYHPVDIFVNSMREDSSNRKVGRAVPRENLMLSYLGPTVMEQLCDAYFEDRGKKFTRRGRNDNIRSITKDVRGVFAEQSKDSASMQLSYIQTATREALELGEGDEILNAEDPGAYFSKAHGVVDLRLRKSIVDVNDRSIGLGLRVLDQDAEDVITNDLRRINTTLGTLGLIGQDIPYSSAGPTIEVFEITTKYGVNDRNGPTIPFVPFQGVSFQPLGIH
jgi:hypothetical protein